MRKLRNLLGEAVEARQPLVFLLDETAIHHSLGSGRFWLGLRCDDGVVAVQPVFGLVVGLEAGLEPLGNRLRARNRRRRPRFRLRGRRLVAIGRRRGLRERTCCRQQRPQHQQNLHDHFFFPFNLDFLPDFFFLSFFNLSFFNLLFAKRSFFGLFFFTLLFFSASAWLR